MQKIALVIGIKDYSFLPGLWNSQNDADDMSAFLEGAAFTVHKLINPTQREMIKAISEFKTKINNNTISIVFFAGHGLQFEGHNFLVPEDANVSILEEVPYFCVNASDLLPISKNHSTQFMHIVILDACRNNPFRSGIRNLNRGLAKMDAPMGTLIAFSTSPNNISLERKTDRNGIYTSCLLKQLKIPNLPLERIFKNTRTEVIKVTNGKQVPWEESSLHGEDFYFLKENTALKVFIKKHFIFAYKTLTEENIEFSSIENNNIKNHVIPFNKAIKLYKEQYNNYKNTIHPRDAFTVIFNLQKILHQAYKFFLLTSRINFKDLDKEVLKASSEFDSKELNEYNKIILTMEHYGSIFSYNDKFQKLNCIERTVNKNVWTGFQLPLDILQNQNRIMEDLLYIQKNEMHLFEIIDCDILLGVMDEFFNSK